MQSETLMRCAHPPCRCLVETEDEFCSAACRRAQHSPDGPCRCGHPECMEKQKAAGRVFQSPQPAGLLDKHAG